MISRWWHKYAPRTAGRSIEQIHRGDATTIVEYVNRQLRAILKHAENTSPFWRQRFQDAGFCADESTSATDLLRLPILEKREVRCLLGQIRSREYPDDICIQSYTGGSTAAPMVFYRDRDCQEFRQANRWFYYHRMGRRETDLQALVWGAAQDLPPHHNFKTFVRSYLVDRTIILPGNRLMPEEMRRFCRVARWLRPRFLHGYSQSIFAFAKFVEQSGCGFCRLNNVSVTAEPILPQQQLFVSDVFGCPVYSIYGTREFGFIAAELPGVDGMYINPTNVVVEIVDDSGLPVGNGCAGHIIVTDLVNRAMPLIRYRIGDVGAWMEVGGPTIEHRALRIVAGRDTDFLHIEGRRISGAAMTLITVPGISQLQYFQSRPNAVEIRYVKAEGFGDLTIRSLENKIRVVLGTNARLSFSSVKELKATASGKFRYVISEVQR